jgi:hypothetical protein
MLRYEYVFMNLVFLINLFKSYGRFKSHSSGTLSTVCGYCYIFYIHKFAHLQASVFSNFAASLRNVIIMER